jgi:hypothetical protein
MHPQPLRGKINRGRSAKVGRYDKKEGGLESSFPEIPIHSSFSERGGEKE